MAVIVREKQIFGEGDIARSRAVNVYRSHALVTREARQKAEGLDKLLFVRMREIIDELKGQGLLERKGRAGVLELWYQLGRRLEFVPTVQVEPEEDREFIWRALYDHAEELVPSKPGSRSLKSREKGTTARAERLKNNHFYYCYRLGQLALELVQAGGDWTSWVEFMDSKRIRNDPRIVEWLAERSVKRPTAAWREFTRSARQKWFRTLTRFIRNRFKKIDTTVLDRKELFQKLDDLFEQAAASNA